MLSKLRPKGPADRPALAAGQGILRYRASERPNGPLDPSRRGKTCRPVGPVLGIHVLQFQALRTWLGDRLARWAAAGRAITVACLAMVLLLLADNLGWAGETKCDEFQLLRAANQASDSLTTGDDVLINIRLVTKQLARQAKTCVTREERAQVILAALHSELLRGRFHPAASCPAQTLATGDYNCLSATILFLELARGCGISAQAVATPGHVLAIVDGDEPLVVQTTCPDWFRVGAASQTLLHRLPANARVLSDRQLIAKVYYNRGLLQLAAGNFAEGLLLTRQACQLDPDDSAAAANLRAGLNNWAIALAAAGDFAAAQANLRELREIAPDFPRPKGSETWPVAKVADPATGQASRTPRSPGSLSPREAVSPLSAVGTLVTSGG